jgi:hypothetical protein
MALLNAERYAERSVERQVGGGCCGAMAAGRRKRARLPTSFVPVPVPVHARTSSHPPATHAPTHPAPPHPTPIPQSKAGRIKLPNAWQVQLDSMPAQAGPASPLVSGDVDFKALLAAVEKMDPEQFAEVDIDKLAAQYAR